MQTICHSWRLDELCACFGDGAVDRLVKARGGRSLCVLLNPTPVLRTLLGAHIALWLCSVGGGSGVDVPSQDEVKRRGKVSEMYRQIQSSNQSMPELTNGFGISTRQVRNVKNKRRDPRLT